MWRLKGPGVGVKKLGDETMNRQTDRMGTCSRSLFLGFIMLVVMLLSAHDAFPQTVAAPKVLYTDIVAGPNSGGENNNGAYLSIFGKNFGGNLSAVKVYIGGGEVARYIYLGPSLGRPDVQQISVQLGPAAATGSIKVTVNDVTSNTDRMFTVRPGNFYFMSKTGSDTTGAVNDITHPFRTANKIWSITALAPGDFIIIRGGTYDLSSGTENLTFSRWMNAGLGTGRSSGNAPFNFITGTSETNAIAVQGYPGEFPVIDWGSSTTGDLHGIQVVGPGSYYVFADLIFDLKEAGGYAIFLGFYTFSGDDAHCWACRLVNLRVQHGMNAGGATGGVNTISLMRVDGLKMYGVDVGNQSPNASSALESHMIYMSHWYTNADLGWLYVHDNAYGRAALQVAGDGWGVTPFFFGTLYGTSGTWGGNSNVKIHDSLFLNLPHECILFNLGSRGPIYVYNNVVSNCMRTQQTGFAPLALRGAYESQGMGQYFFYNNTVQSQAPGTGIFQLGYNSTWPEHVTLYNNIVVQPNAGQHFYVWYNTNFNLTTGMTSDYNIWWGGTSDPKPPFDGAHGMKADPLFVNGAQNNFILQLTSPAIAAGTNAVSSMVSTDYNFNPRVPTYDIGAFQYQTGVAPTIPNPPINLTVQ